jgi:hypothetical protein
MVRSAGRSGVECQTLVIASWNDSSLDHPSDRRLARAVLSTIESPHPFVSPLILLFFTSVTLGKFLFDRLNICSVP